jgi:gas vesicle protein
MNNFTKGILLGVGIGLLCAPFKGEEMRSRLSERLREFRNSLPENEQLNQYAQQVSERVSQTKDSLLDYAQQAASKVKDTSSTLGDMAQQSLKEVKQTSQDVASKTQQAVNSARTGSSTTRVFPETNGFTSQE